MVWYFHLFKKFPQFVVILTVKGFHVINEAEVDGFLLFFFFYFLKFLCFFCDSTNLGNLTSGFSVFSKLSLNICKFFVHILLKPSLKDSEHYFASV